MTPRKPPSTADFTYDIGITDAARRRLHEIDVYTIGEVLDATEARLCKARGFGPVRVATLKRLAAEYLARPVEEEAAPLPIQAVDASLLGRPLLQDLTDFAMSSDEGVRLVLMRDLGNEADDLMTWSAMARKLGISLPTLGRIRRKARDSLREHPLGLLIAGRIHALRRCEGAGLGEALRAEPWAERMPVRAVAMLARMLGGVDIDRGAVEVLF